MTALEQEVSDPRTVADSGASSQFDWEGRAMAVAAVWALPGIVAGALARLCLPDGGPASWWLLGGGILAAIGGGLLESDHLV